MQRLNFTFAMQRQSKSITFIRAAIILSYPVIIKIVQLGLQAGEKNYIVA